MSLFNSQKKSVWIGREKSKCSVLLATISPNNKTTPYQDPISNLSLDLTAQKIDLSNSPHFFVRKRANNSSAWRKNMVLINSRLCQHKEATLRSLKKPIADPSRLVIINSLPVPLSATKACFASPVLIEKEGPSNPFRNSPTVLEEQKFASERKSRKGIIQKLKILAMRRQIANSATNRRTGYCSEKGTGRDALLSQSVLTSCRMPTIQPKETGKFEQQANLRRFLIDHSTLQPSYCAPTKVVTRMERSETSNKPRRSFMAVVSEQSYLKPITPGAIVVKTKEGKRIL